MVNACPTFCLQWNPNAKWRFMDPMSKFTGSVYANDHRDVQKKDIFECSCLLQSGKMGNIHRKLHRYDNKISLEDLY